ncbi:MAG: SDR family NAD(P)-dependent oxidoreductase [Trebonia sp.]
MGGTPSRLLCLCAPSGQDEFFTLVGQLGPFEDLTIEDWRRVIDTNLTGCFLGAQACLPHLKRAKGSIIHIASASGLGGDVGMSAYNASKGAVVNLTRGLAFDLGPYGIGITAGSGQPRFR